MKYKKNHDSSAPVITARGFTFISHQDKKKGDIKHFNYFFFTAHYRHMQPRFQFT